MSYASIAFSDAAKKIQEKFGSRASYARMENQHQTERLSENEIEFISTRDSFYMASIEENGFPYIQFRGGPPGFLKVLNDKQLGFIDFRGNMQYITVGNLATNDKVALFLMDYPSQTRLKIFATAKLIELKDDVILLEKLSLVDYKFKPERMMLLTMEAFNWNCPQHITPRYTLHELEGVFDEQQHHIEELEEEIKILKSQKV